MDLTMLPMALMLMLTGLGSASPVIPVDGSPGFGDGQALCPPGPGVYDPYPGPHDAYPLVAAATPGTWAGEDFEGYADGELVERSTEQGRREHLDVTAGTLTARRINSKDGVTTYTRGVVTDDVFRVLAVGLDDDGSRVRWGNMSVQYRAYLSEYNPDGPIYTGLHVFGRYQTEDDLYVASMRTDGHVTLKRKLCGRYRTLASFYFGAPQTGRWYTLRLEIIGNSLGLYVNGARVLNAVDNAFTWGTAGVRTDHADLYLDDWQFVDVTQKRAKQFMDEK